MDPNFIAFLRLIAGDKESFRFPVNDYGGQKWRRGLTRRRESGVSALSTFPFNQQIRTSSPATKRMSNRYQRFGYRVVRIT
jgi:hypothetical protein